MYINYNKQVIQGACGVGVVSRASVEVSCLISSDLSNWLGAAALGVRKRKHEARFRQTQNARIWQGWWVWL